MLDYETRRAPAPRRTATRTQRTRLPSRYRGPSLTPIPTAMSPSAMSSLTIHDGERIALMGPNGAANPRLLMHLNGIVVAAPARPIDICGMPLPTRR